jgi:hypothetical protein
MTPLKRRSGGGAPNHIEPQPHLRANFPKLAIVWKNLTVGIEWQMPKGVDWHHPAFFLLAPLQTR